MSVHGKRNMWRFLAAVIPLAWIWIQSPPVTAFVASVQKGETRPVISSDPLRETIEREAKERSEPPVNARIDRVWKAVPGYNGLVVDVEETHRVSKNHGTDRPIHWIYKEVPPRVALEDLKKVSGPQPIYRGNEQKPMAALMINVAWGTEYLPSLLHILEREHVSATFFLDGSWLKKHPRQAQRLVAEGHEIGNHAYSHPAMSRLSRGAMRREMEKTEQLIRKHLGLQSRYFAPPSGDFNAAVVQEADQLGMKTVLWTVDTVDWRPTSTPEWMTERVNQHVSNGSLVLMHPTDRTVKALPKIISTIKNKGIKLGTVNEVLSPKRVEHVEPMVSF